MNSALAITTSPSSTIKVPPISRGIQGVCVCVCVCDVFPTTAVLLESEEHRGVDLHEHKLGLLPPSLSLPLQEDKGRVIDQQPGPDHSVKPCQYRMLKRDTETRHSEPIPILLSSRRINRQLLLDDAAVLGNVRSHYKIESNQIVLITHTYLAEGYCGCSKMLVFLAPTVQ